MVPGTMIIQESLITPFMWLTDKGWHCKNEVLANILHNTFSLIWSIAQL